ncbi:MAG: 50S ribosomal protein L18 [Ignisphaera sp.]|nr:50S ribosomal protein L18 [Ignisphaera sp.]
MARGPSYKVPRKRRLLGKTNYYMRYKLLKRHKHIVLVIRKTNKYVIAQFIYPTAIGDFTLVAAHSRELIKLFGWKGGTKNTPAAYLVGLLAGLRARKMGIKHAIPYIGLHRPIKGSKIFAVIKGVLDAGVEVPVDKEMLPDDDRIKGVTIAEYAKMLSEQNPDKFRRQFSAILAQGFDPRNMVEHFEQVKNLILQVYSNIPESKEAESIIEQLPK